MAKKKDKIEVEISDRLIKKLKKYAEAYGFEDVGELLKEIITDWENSIDWR